MDNFNMYQSYKTAFESLDGAQCKALILALFDHAASLEVGDLEPATNMAYLFITSQMDRDRAAYEKKCAKNREIAEKREANKRKATTVGDGAPDGTDVHERDQYKDKDNYKDKDKDSRDIPPIPPKEGDGEDASESLLVQTATGAAPAATHSTTSQDETPPPTPPDEDDPLFVEFWKAYPRKVAKDAARKAWRKRKPDQTLLDTMLKAIAQQVRSRQWREEEGRFIPHPSTWLNKGQWQDELDLDLDPNGGTPQPPKNDLDFLLERGE